MSQQIATRHIIASHRAAVHPTTPHRTLPHHIAIHHPTPPHGLSRHPLVSRTFPPQVVGNHIQGADGYGVWVKFGACPSIRDNDIFAGHGDGVGVWHRQSAPTIASNRITKNEGNGITITKVSRSGLVRGSVGECVCCSAQQPCVHCIRQMM